MNILAAEAGEMDGWKEADGANGTSFVDCSMSRNERRDSHMIQQKNSRRSERQETKGKAGGSGIRSIQGSYLFCGGFSDSVVSG